MSTVPEIDGAVTKLTSVAHRLRTDAGQLLATLEDAKRCGADVRHLDEQTLKVRFLTQIPGGLERKALALVEP